MKRAADMRTSRPGIAVAEIVIIGVILGIVAFLVVPRLSTAGTTGYEAALRDVVRQWRTQVMVYRAEHGGIPPGHPDGDLNAQPTHKALVDQLTLHTDAQGRTSPTPNDHFRFGPYLPALPANPIDGAAAVHFVSPDAPFPAQPTGEGGWIYQASTTILAANTAGADITGKAYFDY